MSPFVWLFALFFETWSLTEYRAPGFVLTAASKPQEFSYLCPLLKGWSYKREIAMSSFYTGKGDQNSGPHSCTSNVPPKPSLQAPHKHILNSERNFLTVSPLHKIVGFLKNQCLNSLSPNLIMIANMFLFIIFQISLLWLEVWQKQVLFFHYFCEIYGHRISRSRYT